MRDPEFHEFDRDFHDPVAAAWVPQKPDFWQRMSRGLEVVLYILLLACVMRIFQPETEKQRKLDVELAQVRKVQSEREARVAELRQEYELLKNDREYLETVARDRLDKAREGEYVIRIDRDEETEPGEADTGDRNRVIRPLHP